MFTATTLVALAYAPIFLRNPTNSDWYRCYVQAAQRMQLREPIHVIEDRPYAYPPLMALLTVPLTKLPLTVAMTAWYFLNVFAISALVASSLALTKDARGSCRQASIETAVALLLISRFVFGVLGTRQSDLIIAALLVSGLLLIRNGWSNLGPVAVGMAAAMKCTPLLFAPYLAWSGRWKCAGIVVLTAVFANLAPDVCYPQSSGRLYLQDWKEEFLDVARDVPPGTWFSGLSQNQSVAGALQRLFRYGGPLPFEKPGNMKLASDRVPSLRIVCYLTYAGLLFGTCLWLSSPAGADRPEAEAALPTSLHQRYLAEIACVLSLMLLLSPMTSRAHFVVLLPVVWMLTQHVIGSRSLVGYATLSSLLVFGPLTSKGLVGERIGEWALACSFPVLYLLVCLSASAYLARLYRRVSYTTSSQPNIEQ